MPDKKNNMDWSFLDTTILYLPNEIQAYYLYIYELAIKNKKTKEASEILKILANYKQRNMEESICLKK